MKKQATSDAKKRAANDVEKDETPKAAVAKPVEIILTHYPRFPSLDFPSPERLAFLRAKEIKWLTILRLGTLFS
jgi:hypothetical protein